MRIITLEETQGIYRPDTTDWEEYFFDIVSVTRWEDQSLAEVKLLFSPEQAPYVQSKPLHPTQKHQKMEQGLEVRITLIPNYELEALLLSYGGTVQVLAPQALKNRMGQRLAQGRAWYAQES